MLATDDLPEHYIPDRLGSPRCVLGRLRRR